MSLAEAVEEYVVRALEALGGRKRLVSGATLGLNMQRLAAADHFDIRSNLRSRELSLLALLRTMAEQYGLKVVPQKGTDFRVGFASAEESPTRTGVVLRHDVYEAFSTFGGGYYYDPVSDRFGASSEPGFVAVASITQSDALEVRRAFANSQTGEERDALLATLEHGNASLRDFGRTVQRLGLNDAWRIHSTESFKQVITDWASANNVAVRQEWFRPARTYRRPPRMAPGFVEALERLNDDDLAQIMVPLSVVSKMFSR